MMWAWERTRDLGAWIAGRWRSVAAACSLFAGSVAATARVSDRDRNDVVERLSVAYADGRLSVEEFNERSAAALISRTAADLDALIEDLPNYFASPAVPAPRSAPAAGSKTLVAFMGGVERKGAWRPAGHIKAIAVMGGIELDFRSAIVAGRSLAVTAVAVMGGIELVVPPNWTVSMSGMSIMGGREQRGSESAGEPVVELHLAAWAVMGGVTVEHRA